MGLGTRWSPHQVPLQYPLDAPQHRRHGQVHGYERAAHQRHGLAYSAWPTSHAASTHSLAGPSPACLLWLPAALPALSGEHALALLAGPMPLCFSLPGTTEYRETQGCFCKYKHSQLLTITCHVRFKDQIKGYGPPVNYLESLCTRKCSFKVDGSK